MSSDIAKRSLEGKITPVGKRGSTWIGYNSFTCFLKIFLLFETHQSMKRQATEKISAFALPFNFKISLSSSTQEKQTNLRF